MIAPEPGEGINPQTSRGLLLRNTLLVSALIFAVLEWWRPLFFLTDDSLDGALPFFIEMGHHLLNGQSPFVSDHLFGGGYNLLRDPDFFAWHPLYLLTSLLAGTPLRLWIVDVDAFVHFMLATTGFVVLANYLRRDLRLTVSDGWIMFYALSFTYSMIALTTGASWLGFMGNQSALPWLAVGILHRDWKRGAGIVVLFSLHQLLGGHFAATVSSSIFFSIFALGVAITRRSFLPLGNWFGGYAVSVIAALPLLIPMLGGFSASARAGGVSLEDMGSYNLPADQLLTSIFSGMAVCFFHPQGPTPHVTYTVALGASAAAWCLLPAMISRKPWRGFEVVTLALMAFGAVLVIRPEWINEIMLRLPLFRSMRWPFRELLQLLFFMHLFLLLRPPGLSRMARRGFAGIGTMFLVVPMALYPLAPTFNEMEWDRELLMTGGFDRYWDKVRSLLGPGDRIAVLIPEEIYAEDRFEEPYSLLGTSNYAAMAGVVNAWGYSPTAPRDQLYTKTYAYYPFGAYRPQQKAALLAERPGLKFITLESLKPLKITQSAGDGTVTDLTSFVPERKNPSK